MNQLVSAIITTHNRKDILKRAIDSVFNQTYSPIELIVVDDGSDDGTSQLCEDTRITYLYIPPQDGRGGNYARNLGIKASKGFYCAFLDDDDAWLPTKIEAQVKLLQEKKCSVVYCLRKMELVIDGKIVGVSNETKNKPSGDLRTEIFKHYITNTSCLLVEKRILEDVGAFDENLRKWQEYDLMIRLSEKSNIYYVDDYLCIYRINLSDKERISNDFGRVYETIQKFKIKYAKRLSELPLKTKIYFVDTCIGDTYKVAKRSNLTLVQLRLFLPFWLLNVFKVIDNPDILKRRAIRIINKFKR